jgi:hypothetical protein
MKNEERRAELGLCLAFGGSKNSGVGLRRLAHVARVQAANFGDLNQRRPVGPEQEPFAVTPRDAWTSPPLLGVASGGSGGGRGSHRVAGRGKRATASVHGTEPGSTCSDVSSARLPGFYQRE